MNIPIRLPRPSLETLFAQFPSGDDLPAYQIVPPALIPSPYRGLLVHEHHMTVTVEAFHGDRVDVRLLARAQHGDSYARKIVLTLQGSGQVVLFGIVRIDLGVCGPEVRKEIVAGRTPLGRILINHNVLRRIEPTAFLRITPGPAQMRWFGLKTPQPLYGRLGIIHCNGQPTVELLEIVAP